MLVYLDQNKWIELARIVHGKETSPRANSILATLSSAVDSGSLTVPLSAIHYIETARIGDPVRRRRLGEVMWRFSRGLACAGYPAVVRHELETALSQVFPSITPRKLQLIGRGSHHAFGVPIPERWSAAFHEELERRVLVGSPEEGMDPPSFQQNRHRTNFKQHLESLYARSRKVPKELLDNWLHAILLVDILDPLNEVMATHGLTKGDLEQLDVTALKGITMSMPTRRVDLHLHKQVLANPNYRPKITDLEDWAGIGCASCYFDVVVCEKHMADLLKRGGFSTKARIETDLGRVFAPAS